MLLTYVVDCGSPPSIFNASPGTSTPGTTLGGMVTYTCDAGYEVSTGVTTAMATCMANGMWGPLPTCQFVDCGFPPTIGNGSPGTPTSTTYQGTVTYNCVIGYEVSTGVTTAIATCMANGIWGPLPACSPVDCGVLTYPSNGAVDTSSGTTFMMTATYSCNTGYNIVEEATRTCGATALWTPEAPTCALLCPDLTIPANGGITYNPTIIPRTEGTMATYTCDTGYQMTGLTVRMCTVTGWSNGEDLVCTAVRCPAGTYQEELSTGESACVPCPGNSFSIVEDSVECICFSGYYKTELEGPNVQCSSPPNNCKSLQVVTERTRGNTITVRWERPEITGRNDLYYNIFYSEDNQTFTQDNSRPYVKQDALVDYSVSGLRPLTTYTIRVIPENGVSDQEEGGQSKTCEIVARTEDTRSNSPSLVIGFCIVVVWTTPTRSYGKITGYDVRFIPQGSGSDLVVSKGRRELFHAVGDTGIVTDNVMVQVSEPSLLASMVARMTVPTLSGTWFR
ncbi:sushi, von Willebrand factor type A, EGF and pentraxin domain-containing protein 1-like isoform X2 [Halichondria panicea]|uniref:sushi, von Willebrand factor type A, EGF and pentraxin domain-containing protein 1-like isoform X2 n=1 Tax=Halichondria panicea TaxID=6063 RepID=UPI00312B74C0